MIPATSVDPCEKIMIPLKAGPRDEFEAGIP